MMVYFSLVVDLNDVDEAKSTDHGKSVQRQLVGFMPMWVHRMGTCRFFFYEADGLGDGNP